MKHIFFPALLLMTISVFAQNNSNLLKNSDFSKLSEKVPALWQCVFPTASCNVNTAEDGKKYLSLTKNDKKSPCMLIQRNLQLDNGKKYLFTCEVQSGKDESKAMIYIEWRAAGKDGKAIHASVTAREFSFSEEWSDCAFEIPVRSSNSEKPYLVISVTDGSLNIRNLQLIEVK